MKNIRLKKMIIDNFKGLRHLVVESAEVIINVLGGNGTGKTTIMDAFFWVLFGKNSAGEAQFAIKTLDENNQVIPGLDHSVTIYLDIDGKEKSFQRIYKEVFAKKRNDGPSQVTKHEVTYLVNGVSVKAGEYKNAVNEIIDEDIFKLITDPMYFGQSLGWEQRLQILAKLFENVDQETIFTANPDLKELAPLLEDFTIKQLQQSLSDKKGKANKELKAIPERIDECNRQIVTLDDRSLESDLKKAESELAKVEDQLEGSLEVDPAIEGRRSRISEIQSQLYNIKAKVEKKHSDKGFDLQSELNKLNRKKSDLENQMSSKNLELSTLGRSVPQLEELMKECIESFKSEKTKVFKHNEDFICPACNRKLDEDVVSGKLEKMEADFNEKKAWNLKQLNEKGKEHEAELKRVQGIIADTKNEVETLQIQITDLTGKITAIKDQITDHDSIELVFPEEYQKLQDEQTKLKAELEAPSDNNAKITELKEQKSFLKNQISDIQSAIYQVKKNAELESRIKELLEQEQKFSQQIAEIERQEILCEDYIITESELLEKQLNDRFTYVNFKLFETQLNGGVKKLCEPLINGVPFRDANNAAKYNAGIDIINTLCMHFGVTAPIFIDNREGINSLISTPSQIINLIVTTDKELKVA